MRSSSCEGAPLATGADTYLSSSTLLFGEAEGLDGASSVTSEMTGPELAEGSGEYKFEPLYAGEEAWKGNGEDAKEALHPESQKRFFCKAHRD